MKDMVEMQDLEAFHAQYRDNHQEPEPSVGFNLNFPSEVKPGDQSESAREFAGKLREMVERDYE